MVTRKDQAGIDQGLNQAETVSLELSDVIKAQFSLYLFFSRFLKPQNPN